MQNAYIFIIGSLGKKLIREAGDKMERFSPS